MRFKLIPTILLAACGAAPELGDRAAELAAPPELAVPAGNHVRAAAHATGFQIYECQPDATGALAWKLRAPLALLYADDDSLAGIHFGGIDAGLPAGPYWQSSLDGSRVHGGNAIAVPNPGSIPFLRLQGLDSDGAGIFAGVTYIQRLATTGGVAPTTKCKKNSAPAYVPYTAEYVFWAASLPRPEVPETIAVPEGHDVDFTGDATGVQIYECTPDANGTLAWRLRAPSAILEDETGAFADHFGGIDADLPAGPYWSSLRDGSRVHAGGALSSPNPGTIALLRLTALDTFGNGIFSRVSFIHRLATDGGVAPATACASGDRTEVPYTATYHFYVPTN
jgi:hypothetical protein